MPAWTRFQTKGDKKLGRQQAVQEQQTEQPVVENENELGMLRGFRDLVAERTGYMFGAKMLAKTMRDKTEAERTAVNNVSKVIRKDLKTWIAESNVEEYEKQQKLLTDAREANKTAREPHMKKISPLRKAVRYIDTVAVPDALKELGTPATARTTLSKVIETALETAQ